MMTPVDYQPPFVPKISVDTKDAAPQRRQTEEISANEIAGIGELCAIDPGDDNFYNLRNVDDTKKSRKKEQQRMREERIQNNRLRKQRKIREAREIEDRARKAAQVLDEQPSYSYCSVDEREREGVYTSEIINEPPSGSGEWLPYESDNEFGTAFELKRTSWGVEKFTLELARCMVGLESFTGDKQLFSCSGTIVEFLNDVGYVVTSASLVRCTYKDAQADELKINVWLASGERLDGCVSNVDFYYNICVIKVSSTFHLPRKSFSPNTGFFDFYECHSKDVVALGRTCKPWSLKVALGKLIPRRSRFDCEELLVSSCKISKPVSRWTLALGDSKIGDSKILTLMERMTLGDGIGVGGPLMDFDGNIIGMSFYDKKETPFLPSFIVLKCLQHFKNFGKVIRPLHGLRVKTLHEAQLTVLEEKIQHGLHGVCGVIVEKVEVPSAEHSEIRVGDIITHVDGVPFSNAAELGGILLDRCGKQMLDTQKSNLSEDCNQMATVISFKFRLKTFRGGKSETTTRTINVDKFTPSGLNRWPLPRKIIELRKAYGVTFDEQWYTIEV